MKDCDFCGLPTALRVLVTSAEMYVCEDCVDLTEMMYS